MVKYEVPEFKYKHLLLRTLQEISRKGFFLGSCGHTDVLNKKISLLVNLKISDTSAAVIKAARMFFSYGAGC